MKRKWELTAEETAIACKRHRVNKAACVTPEGELLSGKRLNGRHAAEAVEYAIKCACAEIVCGADRMLAGRRFLETLKRDDLDVRCEEADFVIDVIEATFKHRQGEALDGTPLRGTPLKLEP